MTAALPGNDVHSLYEKGYAALSQNDYAGAEAAFSQLIDTYPKDPLAEMRNIRSARVTAAASTRRQPTPSLRAIRVRR